VRGAGLRTPSALGIRASTLMGQEGRAPGAAQAGGTAPDTFSGRAVSEPDAAAPSPARLEPKACSLEPLVEKRLAKRPTGLRRRGRVRRRAHPCPAGARTPGASSRPQRRRMSRCTHKGRRHRPAQLPTARCRCGHWPSGRRPACGCQSPRPLLSCPPGQIGRVGGSKRSASVWVRRV
jgi:hypothetical protein